MIDAQIKRAKIEAEQSFKQEMAKMRKETHGQQVFSEQQGNVVAAVSKDVAYVRGELQRLSTQANTRKQQASMQQQVLTAIKITLDGVLKKMDDLEKRFTAIGLPRQAGPSTPPSQPATPANPLLPNLGMPFPGLGVPGMANLPGLGMGAMPGMPGLSD